MTTLVEKILAIEDALSVANVPHAFGGALALAFHIEEPRATRDVDVNVFVPPTRAREIFTVLPAAVTWNDKDVERVRDDGQVRIFWDDTPIDLFFDTHRFHERVAARTDVVPFAGTTIPILGATELTVFKAFFDRTKDWADIEEMVAARTADVHAALGWLVDLLGGDDHRVQRLRGLLERPAPGAEPRFAP